MIRKFLKITGYIFYLLLFVEISLQAFYYFDSGSFLFKRTAVPIFRPDTFMGFSVKPNLNFRHVTNEFDAYLHTNNEGFRTSHLHEEYSTVKDPSHFRILLLGPSFAFGWGVNYEDTFAKQLKDNLIASGFARGREIEVINAGVPAMPPANQLNWFDSYGQKYSPDLVVQFVYGGMWVSDEIDNGFKVDARGYLITENETSAKKFRDLLKNFAIVYYGWVAYTTISSAGTAKDKQILGAGRKLEEQTKFNAGDAARSLNYYYHLTKSVSGAKAKLLIVHFPLSYGVHREDISRWRHLGVGDVDRQAALNETLCAYLTQQAIPCLNITPDLIREAQRSPERLYYWLDIHWTPKGNRIAAQSVARYLSSQAF